MLHTQGHPWAPEFKPPQDRVVQWRGNMNDPHMLLRLEGPGAIRAFKHTAPQKEDQEDEKMSVDKRKKKKKKKKKRERRAISWTLPSLKVEDLVSLEEAVLLPSPSQDWVACSLHKCIQERNHQGALRLLALMRSHKLEAPPLLQNDLVSMLVDAGCMPDAQQVFDGLAWRKPSSWSSLIIGYIKREEKHRAFLVYQKMQEDDSIHPSRYAFVALLKACAELKDLERGCAIHTHILRIGVFANDVFIGSTLISLYAKCGLLEKAQEVFDKLPVRNVVSWNALITGYMQHGLAEKALNCFDQMQLEGVSPNSVTFVCSLKACGSIGATIKGQEIHAQVGTLETNLVIGTALVDMYAKCGLLRKAQDIFDKLPIRDVVSWTALLTGYAQHGYCKEAIKCYEHMRREGVCPDVVAFVGSLKACGSLGALDKGQEIHAEISRTGSLESDLVVCNALIDMYAKCGSLAKAQEIFNKLSKRDVVSWTALIAGYAHQGYGEEALKWFEKMKLEGICPDSVCFVWSLKACSSIGAIDKGQEIHAEISKNGVLQRDPVVVGTALVDMYAKCGLLIKAREVFEKLQVRSTALWNALITGYTQHGNGNEALDCLEQMKQEGICPDAVTFASCLKACGSMGAIDEGQKIHNEVSTKGLLERDFVVGTALVYMYAKCGSLAKAQEVFDKLPVRDPISWNALITGYAQHGPAEKAVYCFDQMRLEGISPDAVTFTCVLKVCGSMRTLEKGRELHAKILEKGWLQGDINVVIALMDMYAKCGSIAEAEEVFHKLPVHDVVSWNVLITGYAEHGCGKKALNCYEQMQAEGVEPDAFTFSCILKACGSIGATKKGQELHTEISKRGLLESDFIVGTALVDMYAKCGLVEKAQEVFDQLMVQDIVAWTALIAGYAQLGESNQVFHMFDRMVGEGVKPNAATFISMLSACSHAGLMHKGQLYFDSMSKDYGISPTLDHLSIMVDLLGRAGQLDKAVVIIKNMPFPADFVIWLTVLGACHKWGNVELAREIFEYALQVNEKDSAAYVCMANIYSDAGMLEDASKVEAMRIERQGWKKT